MGRKHKCICHAKITLFDGSPSWTNKNMNRIKESMDSRN
jgi:hypothetical protein